MARGGLWSLGGQAAIFAATLIATPFTIRLLGPERYGLWALLQAALAWVGLADLGMSQASTKFGGDSLARADSAGEVEAVWTAALITIGVTAAISALAAVVAPSILSRALHVHGSLLGSGVIATRILCVGTVVSVIVGTLNTPQLIRLRWRPYTIVTAGSSILQVAALPIVLAITGGGVATATIVVVIATAISAIGIIFVSARLQPAIRRPRFARRIVPKLLRYGGALTVSGIASIPLTTAERLLLGHYRSTLVVAYYVVASRLATLLSVIPGAVTQPLFPALVSLEGSGQMDAARALYRQALQGTFLIVTPATLALAFIAHPFLALWAGAIYGRHSTVPLYIALVGVWLNAVAFVPYTYLLASGQTGVIARIHVLEIAPYVAGAALLTSAYGAIGAAVVSSARAIVDSTVFSWSAWRNGNTVSPLSDRRLVAVLTPLGLSASLWLLSTVTSTLAARIMYAVPTLMLYAVVVWFVLLTARERAGLGSLVGQIVPGRRASA